MRRVILYTLLLGLPALTVAANLEAGRLVRGAIAVGIGLAFLDAVKCSLPFLIKSGWSAGRRFTAIVGALLMIVLASLSGFAVQGLLAHLMATNIAAVSNGNTRLTDTRTELADIAQRLQRDGWARPAAQVQADLDAERRSPRYTDTRECTSATAPSARTFCAGLDKLRGELAAAERGDNLRKREAELRSRLDAAGAGPMPVAEDLSMLAGLTGLDQKALTWWTAALLAIALEVAALTVPVLAAAALQPPAVLSAKAPAAAPAAATPSSAAPAGTTHSKKSAVAKASPPSMASPLAPPTKAKSAPNVVAFSRPTPSIVTSQKPKNGGPQVTMLAVATSPPEAVLSSPEEAIFTFLVEVTTQADGEDISSADLHAAYVHWCGLRDIEAISKVAFGRHLASLPHLRRRTLNGYTRIAGLALRSTQP